MPDSAIGPGGSFNINPVQQWSSASTKIRRPREIAYFSFDNNHELRPFSDESLSYYYPPFFPTPHVPRSPIDLVQGFQSFRKHDDTEDRHLHGLLDTLMELEKKTGERVKTDIVTWRGMLTKILTAPFEDNFNDFEMRATCYQGSIFIVENKAYKLAGELKSSDTKIRRPGSLLQEHLQYTGYRFETISVLPRPWSECTRDEIEGRDHHVVDNHAQYCSIVRTGIGATSLVLAGEVDCVLGAKPEHPEEPIPWVELKTTRQILHNRDAVTYERKLCKFWAQSFLLGVPKIVVGFRTVDGQLASVSELDTQNIPVGVQQTGKRTWDGNSCINFAAAFLAFLQRTVHGEGVWLIRRRHHSSVIEVYCTEAKGTGSILEPAFKQHREAMLAKEVVHMLDKQSNVDVVNSGC